MGKRHVNEDNESGGGFLEARRNMKILNQRTWQDFLQKKINVHPYFKAWHGCLNNENNEPPLFILFDVLTQQPSGSICNDFEKRSVFPAAYDKRRMSCCFLQSRGEYQDNGWFI